MARSREGRAVGGKCAGKRKDRENLGGNVKIMEMKGLLKGEERTQGSTEVSPTACGSPQMADIDFVN